MTARNVTPTWRERAIFSTLITACLAGIAYGSWQMVEAKHEHVTSVEKANYDVARDRLTSRAGHVLRLIATAEDAIASEAKTLADSQGKTLDETARTQLETQTRLDTFQVAIAREELRQTWAAAKTPKPSYWAVEYAPAAARLDQRVFISAGHLTALPKRAETVSKAVTNAVAVWQKEQERIAAEKAAKEAAERAAAEAARAAAARSYSTSNTPSGGSSSVASSRPYVEHVGAYGWQSEIDECIGAVDVTSHYFGIHTIARHNYCGGSAFPKYAGAIVQLAGAEGGLYRVIGVVAHLNGHTNTTDDLPRGYDLLYQTCVNGYSNMSFTALERIG